MANEFKVKHGLIVNGSGSTVLDVQGSQGQLFSITDSLSGSLFSVGDISGIPILEVFSDDTVKIGSYNSEAIVVSGSHATVSGSFSGSFEGDGSGLTGIGTVDTSGTPANNQIAIFTDADTIEGDTNLTWDGSTFNINGTGSVDLLRVDDRLQGNGSGFQFFAYNEDTVKVKFANWYSSNDRQYGMGQLWFETWFAAIDNQASRDERRIGFYLEEPDAGSTDSGTPGQHPTNARFYVDINGAYLSGSFEASGDITGSDIKIDDWGSVSASLASINASGYVDGTGAANKVAIWSDSDTLTSDTNLHWDTSNDRLGIGTTTPTQKLEVREGFIISSGSLTTAGFVLDRAGQDTYQLRHMDGGLTVYNSTETRKEMTFNGAGQVGIGTTAPTETLTVEGSISASGDIHINNNQGLVSKNVAGADRTLIELDNSNVLKIKGNDSEGSTNVITMVDGGDVTFPADVTVAGSITAQEFHTEFVSASIIFESGSTKFGDTVDDKHEFTGSVEVLMDTSAGDRTFILDGSTGTRLQRRGDTSGYASEYGFNGNDGTDLGGFGALVDNTSLTRYYIGPSYNNSYVSILANGNVGIGTTTASTVGGTAKMTINVGSGTSAPVSIVNGTTDGMYIRRYSTGGSYQLQTTVSSGNAGKLSLQTYGGSVGIGTTTPDEELNVSGSVRVDDGELYVTRDGSSRKSVRLHQTTDKGAITLQRDGVDNVNISSDQIAQGHTYFNGSSVNVGIGTTTPDEKLTVEGNISGSGTINVASSITGSDVKIDDWGSVSASLASINASGYVDGSGTTNYVSKWSDSDTLTDSVIYDNGTNIGIGTATASSKLTVAGNITQTSNSFLISTRKITARDSNGLSLYNDGGAGIDIKDSGNVGIGTTTPQATLHVEGNITGSGNIDINGTLTAAVKSFDIPHPTQEGKRLVYGVLEGPEHAVYVRGESKADTIILPEEWVGLVDETTITIQLTPIGSPDIYYYLGYEDNTVKVGGPQEKNYFYYIQATRKDIEPLTTVQ